MLLEINNLSFSYGSQKILDLINFEVSKGERLIILGNNGVGKSTLIKCINQIIKPEIGSISLDKKVLNSYKQNAIAKKIACVPQSIALFDQTVFDAVLLGRKPYIKYQATKEDFIKTQKTIDELSLSHLALKNTNKLSGGERQKVAIATAINQDTEIILLDEPTANLDIKNQLEVCDFIKQISINKQKTLIITMHDINLALKLGTKFLVLKDSKIFTIGDESIITKELIKEVFNISSETISLNDQKRLIFI
ncbi:MAG: iron ABC transporter ATP-binding protein [Tenericutes bacterium HGW-Tenericutes-5]|nr:MAG: iron ABC transporter ATP-binding protein [Tenericutes bacterium HGW-Tenericutes-5]